MNSPAATVILPAYFERHCDRVRHLFASQQINFEEVDYKKRLLIGSYFTNEYSIESAAFFNPSLIEDIDQSGLEEGEKRVIISFRAVGEGHISSIAFRHGTINRDNEIKLITAGNVRRRGGGDPQRHLS